MEQIKLEDLKGRMCRWPHGDPKDEDFHFCGEQSEEGRVYCSEHEERSRRTALSIEREKRLAQQRAKEHEQAKIQAQTQTQEREEKKAA